MGTFRPASEQVSDVLLSFMAQVQHQLQTLTCFSRMKCTFEWHPAQGTCCASWRAGCSPPRNPGEGVVDAQSLPAAPCAWGKEAAGEPWPGQGTVKVVAGEGGEAGPFNASPLGQSFPSHPPLTIYKLAKVRCEWGCMGFPCQQGLWTDGDTPLQGMRSVSGSPLCLRHPPSLPPLWISSPGKQHSHPRLCVSRQPFLSIPLCVRGPDLVPRVESFRTPPIPGHFLGRNCHYKYFQGPALWETNLMGTPTCNYHDSHY